jgi:predicted TIM-barrel fold metal-dependent hydrolase
VILCTHSGSGEGLAISMGPGAFPIAIVEAGGWPSRRNMTRMIFAGVFERHPSLRLMLTEQNGEWWTHQVMEYDGIWHTTRSVVGSVVPRPPHEYMRENVFIGASFIANFEAQTAVNEGYWENVIWGRDYPHVEGTWTYREDESAETATSEHLRWAFSGIPTDPTRAMLGENAIRALGLDRPYLESMAARIASPTLDDLAKPLDMIPADGGGLAFRQFGPWG